MTKKLEKKALVCFPSKSVADGLRMKDRGVVNVNTLMEQHKKFVGLLQWLGYRVIVMQGSAVFPDSVFPEDPGVILQKNGKQCLVVTKLQDPSRQGEEERLRDYLVPAYFGENEVRYIENQGSSKSFLEGGDVLIAEDRLFIGLSGRTNHFGAEQLAKIAYDEFRMQTKIFSIPNHWLHLKGAVSYHRAFSGLTQPVITVAEPIAKQFRDSPYSRIIVPENEHDSCYGANCTSNEGRVLVHRGATYTGESLFQLGFTVQTAGLSEFWKIDGAMSCLSKIFV